MKKQIQSIKTLFIMFGAIVAVFFVLNTIFLAKVSHNLDELSEKTLNASDKYYELRKEFTDEKTRMALMAHVLDIKNILESFKNKTNSYNTMEFALLIAKESYRNNLDPLLVLAVIKTESSFRKSVVSHKGAIGLMQILPNTGHYVSDMHDHIDLGSSQQLFEPDTNIKIGINYLSYLMNKFENQKYAILAYNMGPTNLIRKLRSGENLPEKYYRSVMKNYQHIMSISGRT